MRQVRQTHKTEIEAIRNTLEAIGAEVFVLHQSGRLFGSAGIPDLYIRFGHRSMAKRPFRLWWEVKVGRDRLRDAQTRFIDGELADCENDAVHAGWGDLAALIALVNPLLKQPVRM